MTRAMFVTVVLGLGACAGETPPGGSPEAPCAAYAESACLMADAMADPGRVPPPERVSEVLRAAFAFWGAPADALSGWRVVFTFDGPICNCPDAGACTIWSAREIRILVPRLGSCPEGALVHELGHVILPGGDPGHADPRFGRLRNVLATLGC